MSKIRWGILSTAKIGMKQVIPAMQKSVHCDVQAIASRQLSGAQEAAADLAISRAYGSYEQLLEDPDIDAIYIPLPNHLHVSWTIRCLEAGKHVLCEKPIGMDAEDARHLLEVVKTYPKLKVMEAFMYRFHTQWKQVKQFVEEGAIGELKSIHSVFAYYNDDPMNIRNLKEAGGGALMDIGCYNLSLSRFLFNAEPKRVLGILDMDARFGVDRMTTGFLDFGHGTSVFTCSSRLSPVQRVQIFGTDGRVEIEIPFNPPDDKPCRLWLKQGNKEREILTDVCNQYQLQCDAFSQTILEDRDVPVPLEDALANMIVLDAIRKSSDSGEWVDLSYPI